MAADAIVQHLTARRRAVAPTPAGDRTYLPRTSLLADAVRESNQFIYTQGRRDARHEKMGTTVVTAWIAGHVASVAHVGDSRAYLWYGDRLEPLTRDHSLAGVAAGHDVLVRVLGREPDVDVDVNEVPVRSGDFLVLCSDGLTRTVSEKTVARAIAQLRHPQRICDYLVDAANGNGGADNITVVVVEVMDRWWRRWSWWRHGGGGHDAKNHVAV
jgi:protein phosphatase